MTTPRTRRTSSVRIEPTLKQWAEDWARLVGVSWTTLLNEFMTRAAAASPPPEDASDMDPELVDTLRRQIQITAFIPVERRTVQWAQIARSHDHLDDRWKEISESAHMTDAGKAFAQEDIEQARAMLKEREKTWVNARVERIR